MPEYSHIFAWARSVVVEHFGGGLGSSYMLVTTAG